MGKGFRVAWVAGEIGELAGIGGVVVEFHAVATAVPFGVTPARGADTAAPILGVLPTPGLGEGRFVQRGARVIQQGPEALALQVAGRGHAGEVAQRGKRPAWTAVSAGRKCAELCPHGVHVRYKGYNRTVRPKDHLCRGFHCRENCDYYCIDKCPVGALSMGLNPVYETMGDPRWTPDMILSTWDQAENGTITNDDARLLPRQVRRRLRQIAAELPERTGEEAQGVADRHPAQAQQARRQAGRHRRALVRRRHVVRLGQPAHDARARRAPAMAWNTFSCTGEGGYPSGCSRTTTT